MKLVKIEDVRVGQIWRSNVNKSVDVLIVEDYSDKYIQTSIKKDSFDGIKQNFYLVGFLNITHKIENDRLVEIPRNEFEDDDVVNIIIHGPWTPDYDCGSDFKEVMSVIRSVTDDAIYDCEGCEWNISDCQSIGIYGVTHEFVNERLVK